MAPEKSPQKAYSYLRFSTPDQLKGDSYRRQTQLAQEYARKHALQLDESLTFEDLGVSAYRSRNAKTGALRAFLDAVDGGVIHKGAYLLVESLDRVSRDDILAAQGLFLEIINAGVTLVTLVDSRAYSRASVVANPTDLIISLLTMMRANEESLTKARRVSAAWQAKRDKASSIPLTAACPGWLRLNKQAGKFEPVPERVRAVRRVFELALEGRGKEAIAQAMNRAGVRPFRGGDMWHRSYVAKLLENQAVIGTYVPHQYQYHDGKRTRVPLQAVPNYYPAIIDEETWSAARALQDSRSPTRGRHAMRPLVNLLGGLCVCPKCASAMTMVNKGQSRRKLVCSRAKGGAGCEYRSVDYAGIEAAVLDQVYWLVNDRPSSSPEEATVRAQLDAVQSSLESTHDALENVLRAVEKGKDSPALRTRLAALEAAEAQLRGEERALQMRFEAVARTMLDRKAEQLLEAVQEPEPSKERINAALRGLFKSVVIDYVQGELRFEWVAGGSSEVMYAWPAEDAKK